MNRSNALAYAVLCLITGSGWVIDAALPAALPGAIHLLADNALLALIFFVAGPKLPPKSLQIIAYAALIFAVPGALVSFADGRLSSTTIVLVYTLVSAATVFFAAQFSQDDLLRLLGPALVGVGGAALLLPFALPSSLGGRCWLAAIVLSALVAAFAGLRLHALLACTSTMSIATLAAAASALVALPLYAYERPTLVLLTWQRAVLSESIHLAFQAATLFLAARLLRTLDPIAFSTRYFLIPLVTIAEGYFLLHPVAGWTLPIGAALLACASLLLLRPAHQT